MLQYPDLSVFSEEERMQLMTVMKKAQVYFVVISFSSWEMGKMRPVRPRPARLRGCHETPHRTHRPHRPEI